MVTRVHDLVPKDVWSKRYDRINEFEKNLVQSGTHILKFFLHISPQEQLRRFKQRLDDPHKQWKISESDYTERAYWDDYMKAYEAALERTSTHRAPWFVIPSDHKWFRNLAVARILVETLDDVRLRYPPPTGRPRRYRAQVPRRHERRHRLRRAQFTKRRRMRRRRESIYGSFIDARTARSRRRAEAVRRCCPRAPACPRR